MKSKNKTQRSYKIFPYKNKIMQSLEVQKNINQKKQNTSPITLPNNPINTEINNSIKNDSLSTLRKYINSSKPYMFKSSMRKKMKYIKKAHKEDFDNFYWTNIKRSSARFLQNNELFKDCKDPSFFIKPKNKRFKINIENKDDIKNDNFDIGYKTTYSTIKNNKRKRNLSNSSKINYSKFFNNRTEYKTDYSSLTTAALSSGNFYKNSKHKNKNLYNIYEKYDYNDSLGYKNSNIKEPRYSKKGIIRSFMNEIDTIRKDNYKNYCLKLSELKKNWYTDNYLSLIRLDERTKIIANHLLNLYSDGYHNYYLQLKKKINKEYDKNEDLIFEIKNLKLELNKLTLKIQKNLIKLSIFVEIRDFLIELKDFSSYPFGTSYKILSEVKNKSMEIIQNNEAQTNFNLYLLSNKDTGIDLFINKYKTSSLNNLSNNNGNNKVFTSIKEFISIPNKLDSNIKNLLWKQNLLERDIDVLKSNLSVALEDSINDKIYQDKITYQFNNLFKKISRLKTENEILNYKFEFLKKNKKIKKYGNINKHIIDKIFLLFNNFKNYEYITKDELYDLSKIPPNEMIKYLNYMLFIIEKKIILLMKFKIEVINKDPKLKNEYELNNKIQSFARRKLKELNDRNNKNKKTLEKLNKFKYINEKKDFYFIYRTMTMKKINKKISEEKEKILISKKTPVEMVMDIIQNT